MTLLVHHLGIGAWALASGNAAWLQAWAPEPVALEHGIVVYIAAYDRDEPRGLADGETWHVVHAVTDGHGVTLLADGPVYVRWAEQPLEYAVEPYEQAWWGGPGDMDSDGDKDIADLLCYLDWWFIESGEPLMLADFVGVWW